MFNHRLDLPLARDANGQYLAWIVAVMVYLAVLALASATVLAGVAERWDRGLSGALTVQISPSPELADPRMTADATAPLSARTELALALLRTTPGVERAEAIPAGRAAHLLEPWLGGSLPADLPMPALIDVVLKKSAAVNVDALAVRLATAVPGAKVDDHAGWLAELRKLAQVVQMIAIGIVGLIGSAAVLAVVFAVRAGLAIHHPVVELLHIMGATDRYVARQFEAHVLGLAMRGAAAGTALAVATLVAIGRVASQVRVAALPELSLSPLEVMVLAVVPVVACGLAVLTTRWTVGRKLALMP